MYQEKTIGVVVPAFNEELLIRKTIDTMPKFVDVVIVINDASRDRTGEILDEYSAKDPRIHVIHHEKNKGLGQSLIDGYVEARERSIDIVAVMAGDAQMSPADLPAVLEPIASGVADYVKGNRLLRDEVISRMPKHRLIGNAGLTYLTKMATGYWRLLDPQCGYTAISGDALSKVPIEKMTKGYGYNADILNMLNLNSFRVKDVEVEPVYGEEKSKIKLWKYIPHVSWLLFRLTLRRLFRKYVVREFHPLIFFYLFGLFSAFCVSLPLLIRLFYFFSLYGEVPRTTLIILVFSLNMSFLTLFFGMWMDMEDNRRLQP